MNNITRLADLFVESGIHLKSAVYWGDLARELILELIAELFSLNDNNYGKDIFVRLTITRKQNIYYF